MPCRDALLAGCGRTLLVVSALLLASDAAAPAPVWAAPDGTQEIRLHAPSAPRWLIRFELHALVPVHAQIDGRRTRARIWSTENGSEFLIQAGDFHFLVDARQRLLFQIPATGIDQQADQLRIGLPYPVPESPAPITDIEGPLQLSEPAVETGEGLLPESDGASEALQDPAGGIAYRPNVRGRNFHEVYRVAFSAGGHRYEIFLAARPS